MPESAAVPRPPGPSLLARLGLGRPELVAWALYDWANSVFMTIILLVYPIYFTKVAGANLAPVVATARIAFATAISMTLIAVLSPILGAMADHAGIKKKMLAVFLGFGALATAALYFVVGISGILIAVTADDWSRRIFWAVIAVAFLMLGGTLVATLRARGKP